MKSIPLPYLLLVGTILASTHSETAKAQWYGTSVASTAPGSEVKNVTGTIVAPNSTSAFKMQGLAGAITPNISGNIYVVICGTLVASAAGATGATAGISLQLSWGSGSAAPGSNATLTGTQVGVIQEYRNGFNLTASGDLLTPFSVASVITGLTPGTSAWLDLAAESVSTASAIGLTNVNISAIEIPPR